MAIFLAPAQCKAGAWDELQSMSGGSAGVPDVPTPVYNGPDSGDGADTVSSTISDSDQSGNLSVPASSGAVNAAVMRQQESDWQNQRQNTVRIQQQQAADQQARQNQFQEGKNDLLQNVKGGTSGALGLKTGSGGGLSLKKSSGSDSSSGHESFAGDGSLRIGSESAD